MGLGKKVLFSVGWTTVAAYFGAAISFGGNIFLARLLGPEDFGVFALASSTLMIVFMISAFGSQEAIIQCREDGLQHFLPTAFWMTIGLGIMLAFIGTMLGLYLQSIHEKTIGVLIVLMSWTNLLNMISAAYGAILKRQLSYKPIAIIGTVATFISFSIAIYAAYYDGGVWSLFLRESVQAVLVLAGYILITGYHLPIKFDRKSASWIFNFGWKVMGSGISEKVLTSLDKLAIGTYLGKTVLGNYSLAYRLTTVGHQFSQGVVSSVSMSTFAILQKDSHRLRLAFERIYYWLFRIVFILALVVWFGGSDLVILIYGSQWQKAGNIFQQMSVLLFFLPLTGALKIFLIASGNINAVLKTQAWKLVFFIPAIFLATSYWQNITIVVWVVSSSIFLGWFLMIRYVTKVIPVDWRYIILKPTVIGCISLIVGNILSEKSNLQGVVLAVIIGAGFCIITLFTERSSLQAEWAVIRGQWTSN